MIQQLRRRFIWTTMGILTTFLVILLVALNILFTTMGYQQNVSILRQVVREGWATGQNSSHPSTDFGGNEEGRLQLDGYPVYVCQLDTDDSFLEWRTADNSAIPEDLTQLMEESLASGPRDHGLNGTYLYARVFHTDREYLAVMDTSAGVLPLERLRITSLVVCLVCLLVLYPICVFLSRSVTRSTEQAFIQQKQFISDAGHELKTPLSIIAVNANVLEDQVGDSPHMGYIRSEIQRMHHLISQLLTLAKTEEGVPAREKLPFSLSDLLFQACLPFESLSFEKGIDYQMDIDEDIDYIGQEEGLRQVATILLDNAFKYTHDQVSISLKPHGKGCIFEVYNNGGTISPQDLPHIFERFYRCDKSRTDAEGYGLGLPIAQSIITGHGGHLTAHPQHPNGMCFRVVL